MILISQKKNKNRLEKGAAIAEQDIGKGASKGWNTGKGAVNRMEKGFRKEEDKNKK